MRDIKNKVKLLNIKKLDPSMFTYSLYCGQAGVPTHLHFNDNTIYDNSVFFLEGYCNSNELEIRPRIDGVAFMIHHKEFGRFWCHFTEFELEILLEKRGIE